jgi:hypothetical protein
LISAGRTSGEAIIFSSFGQRNDRRIARSETSVVPVEIFICLTGEGTEISFSLDIENPWIITHITTSTVPIKVLGRFTRVLTE